MLVVQYSYTWFILYGQTLVGEREAGNIGSDVDWWCEMETDDGVVQVELFLSRELESRTHGFKQLKGVN